MDLSKIYWIWIFLSSLREKKNKNGVENKTICPKNSNQFGKITEAGINNTTRTYILIIFIRRIPKIYIHKTYLPKCIDDLLYSKEELYLHLLLSIYIHNQTTRWVPLHSLSTRFWFFWTKKHSCPIVTLSRLPIQSSLKKIIIIINPCLYTHFQFTFSYNLCEI